MAVQSFADRGLEAIFERRWPGNGLHALTGDRAGQHAIRVNDQFRICFAWTPAEPAQVEFVDYH